MSNALTVPDRTALEVDNRIRIFNDQIFNVYHNGIITAATTSTTTTSIPMYRTGDTIVVTGTNSTNTNIYLGNNGNSNIIIVNGIGNWVTPYGTTYTQPYAYVPPTEEEQRRSRAEYEKKRLHAVHRAKGSIKRALKLMDNVGFGNDIRIFLGGDDIEVSHPESMFKFVLTKYNNSLINKTIEAGISTPYKLQLFTKTNVHVANLCVILKDTPVLDQVLAVSMFVRTGDEDYILERANWSAITDDEDTLLEIGLYRSNLRGKFRHKRFSNPDIQDIFTN